MIILKLKQTSIRLIQKNYLNRTTKRLLNLSSVNYADKFSPLLPPFVEKPYSYAIGRSTTPLRYKTIGQLFDERLESEDGKPTIISHYEGIKKNFTDLHNDVSNLAKSLHEHLHLKRGDVVGLWYCNSYDWILVQYACARLGLILCTLNPYYQVNELNYALRKADIKALFMPGKNSKQEIINKFSKIINLTLNTKDEDPTLALKLENIISLDGDMIEPSDLPSNRKIKCFHLDKLRQTKGELDSSIIKQVSPDDPALIVYTSGTTGKPKGACLSHFSITNNVRICATRIQISNDSILCLPLPFFHVFAGLLGNLCILFNRAQIVIPCLKYNVGQVAEAINVNKVTHMYATPTLAMDLLNYLRNKDIKTPTLKGIFAGGASVPVEIVHQILEYIPSCEYVRIGYGATESGPAATICTPDCSLQESSETVGSPQDYIEVKLVDPQTKNVVKLGETGELHTRGAHIMLGYWKEKEKTESVLDSAGWYNTEDLAVMNEKGLIKIIGRTKEMIIVGGENVYPTEVEEFLYMHPAIETVHVIGIPDARRGEEVCAWVRLHKNSKLTEDELKDFCKDKITYFKIPKYVLFVDEFPLTPTGKAQKFLMRQMTIEKLKLQDTKAN